MLIENDNYKLYLGDCLEVMDMLIEKGVKVDMVLCDPPYGTTSCKWDTIIPLDEMWERLNKIVKPNGAILLFGAEPFSSNLRMSNIKKYKYDWIWSKGRGSDFLNAKRKPLASYENICVFYKKAPTYNPQFWYSKPYEGVKARNGSCNNQCYGSTKDTIWCSPDGRRYPINVINIDAMARSRLHPTQKPVELLEYLIKTYTNEGELVLDFTMGSGSTGVACMNTSRHFIGIELDKEYFNIAVSRIENKE